MARLARVVAPGLPHHVTQRGNRRQKTFFNEGDYAEYQRLLARSCENCGTEVWAYCLMPNHVHLILVQRRNGVACSVGGGASAVYAVCERPRGLARAPVAGALPLVM